MMWAADRHTQLQQFLMSYRNIGNSSAKMMFGTRLPTLLDRIKPTPQTTARKMQVNHKAAYDQKTKPRDFRAQGVWFRHRKEDPWRQGEVIAKRAWASYDMVTQDNRTLRVHADHMRSQAVPTEHVTNPIPPANIASPDREEDGTERDPRTDDGKEAPEMINTRTLRRSSRIRRPPPRFRNT
ncbi:hypothetical protein ACOME3_004411 [Neoechinorhynchus agilis]